jgi:ankyrin repeat protein
VIDVLMEAAKAGDHLAVREILARSPELVLQRLPSGETPLIAALYRGHRPVVDALVELGAPVDVFAAAATGRLPDLVRALDHPGAVNACSFDGWTPLHLASFFGQLDAARALLDAGAAVAAVSHNSLRNTPLHAAAAGKHAAIALLLLERGADPSIRDAGDATPLRIADENGLTDVADAIRRRSERR